MILSFISGLILGTMIGYIAKHRLQVDELRRGRAPDMNWDVPDHKAEQPMTASERAAEVEDTAVTEMERIRRDKERETLP